MLLVVDIGNTNIVLGVFEERQLRATWRIATLRERTADEYGALLAGLLTVRGIDPDGIEAAVVSCVVPPLVQRMESALHSYFHVDPLFVEPGIKTGIAVVSEMPQEVGADRIVNAVAAHDRCGSAAIVVDFGTATTVDAISSRGQYLGGAIAPGIEIGAEALFARAAKLPRVELRRPARVIGRNTVQSLQSGLYHGYVGMVRGLVEKMKTELEGEIRVLATGGFLELFQDELADCLDEFVPDLTLQGLLLIHERNL
jgi:type III pantothenate kinase